MKCTSPATCQLANIPLRSKPNLWREGLPASNALLEFPTGQRALSSAKVIQPRELEEDCWLCRVARTVTPDGQAARTDFVTISSFLDADISKGQPGFAACPGTHR